MSLSKRSIEFGMQSGVYKIKVKGGASWSEHNVATLDISVGQEKHEGAKFEALCAWANERFETVIVSVNDSLQRYNLKGLTEEEALRQSIKEGTEWIKRNLSSLNMLENKVFQRWEDFRQREGFAKKLEHVNEHYQNDKSFRDAIEGQALDMWKRRSKGTLASGEEFEEFMNISKLYFLEETAVFALMDAEQDSIHIYPGSFMKIWDLFKDNPVEGLEALSYRSYNRIDFAKRKNTK